jgi:hypothetical protein
VCDPRGENSGLDTFMVKARAVSFHQMKRKKTKLEGKLKGNKR